MEIENKNGCEETQQNSIQKYDKSIFDGGKSDWLSLSVNEQLDRILKRIERKQRLKKYGRDYEEYDENDTQEIREAKILRNVFRMLRRKRQR